MKSNKVTNAFYWHAPVCRSNLDLFHEFDDEALWDVLRKVHMHKRISGLGGKVWMVHPNQYLVRTMHSMRADNPSSCLVDMAR
jgi:hypothetical protein